MINLRAFANMLAQKFDLMESYDCYKFFLSQFYLAKFVLGKENFLETDCSGILSGALFMMGYNIRCTAQFFHDHIFLQSAKPFVYPLEYLVAFRIQQSTGEVVHMLPHIENGIYLDARGMVELIEECLLEERYNCSGYHVEYRTTSPKVLSAFSISLLASTRVDSELVSLRSV